MGKFLSVMWLHVLWDLILGKELSVAYYIIQNKCNCLHVNGSAVIPVVLLGTFGQNRDILYIRNRM